MTLKVQGMSCQHCVAAVKKALSAVPGVTSVEVDLDKETVTVEGIADAAQVKAAIEDAGYDVA